MTERPIWAATDKQRNYLRGLAGERDITLEARKMLETLSERQDLTRDKIGELIDDLCAKPKRKVTHARPAAGVRINDLHTTTTFAIPTSSLSVEAAAYAGNSNLLFGEVREYRGNKFMDALHGAPSAFARTRVPRSAERDEIVTLLMGDMRKYQMLFAEHYSVCGRCAAELTDTISRATKLGPTCRRIMGV